MHQLLVRTVSDGRVARVGHSTRADRDLAPATVAPAQLAERRRSALGNVCWRVVHQVHGNTVVDADSDDRPFADADAIMTSQTGTAVAVHSGDCVPIGLVHDHGAVASVHAGWKGLEVGVIDSAARALRTCFGDGPIVAAIGPHIRAGRYEFGRADLERLVARFGPSAASTTTAGQPALDLTAVTTIALERAGVAVAVTSPDCTAAESDRYWSYRARAESGRIALVSWLENS